MNESTKDLAKMLAKLKEIEDILTSLPPWTEVAQVKAQNFDALLRMARSAVELALNLDQLLHKYETQRSQNN
jgi:hypothetical protein